MGKYAKVIEKLAPLPAEDASYQAKVDAEKSRLLSINDGPMSSSALASRYRSLKRKKDRIEAVLYARNLQIMAVEQLIADSYEEDKITSLKLDDGSNVYTQSEPVAKIEDKEKFRLWCVANGLERSLALHPSSTQSLIKERLLEGLPEPDGVRAFARTQVRLRRG